MGPNTNVLENLGVKKCELLGKSYTFQTSSKIRWRLSGSRESPIRACFHSFQSKANCSANHSDSCLMSMLHHHSGQGASPVRKAKYKYCPKEKRHSPPPVLAVCLTSCILCSSSPVLFSFPACGINPHGPLPGFLSPLDLRRHCLVMPLYPVPSPNFIPWFLYMLLVWA